MQEKRPRKAPVNHRKDSPPVVQEKVVSVFLIPEFICSPPEYAVNLENKSTAGFHPHYFFPSGNMEETNASPEAAATRECLEETGITITNLQRSDLIGKLKVIDRRGGGIVYVYIYTKRIPSNTRTRPGDEQIEVLRLAAEDIENLIIGKFMGVDHVEAWKLYKQARSKRSRYIRKK